MDTRITSIKSTLTQIELTAMEKVSDFSKPYVQAKDSIKVSVMDRTDCLMKLFMLISSSINASGQNNKILLDDDQLKNVSKFVYNYVLENYKGITIKEIESALKIGITFEYGDFVGFGVSTLTKFIKGYMTSQKRETAMKEWLKAQDEPFTTNKPVTKFLEQNTQLLNDFFDLITPELSKRIDTLYTINDTIYHLPSLYDFIRKTYVVEFTPETKEKIIKDAKVSYYNYIKKSGLPQHKKEQFDMVVQSVKDYSKDELMKIIDTYDQSGINITYDYHVKSEALKVVLLGIKAKGKRPENLRSI